MILLLKNFLSFSYVKILEIFREKTNPNDDSDLDICIITNDKSSRKIDIMKTIRKSISKVATMPVDLLVYYIDEFKERAEIDCTIEHQILFQGVKIYG
jgi:uncharacterized protein